MKRAYMRLGGLLESVCNVADHSLPAWPWLMGSARCPNGIFARLAFRCYKRADCLSEPSL